jgi:hypothetical protein
MTYFEKFFRSLGIYSISDCGIYFWFEVILFLSVPISFVLRGLPIFKQIWMFWKIIFIGLIIMFAADLVKKSVKDWFKD